MCTNVQLFVKRLWFILGDCVWEIQFIIGLFYENIKNN